MGERKRRLPSFLGGVVSEEVYLRWLLRKAQAHVVRDRARGMTATGAQYRDAIHEAVVASEGLDHYTGEHLDWHLISTYANAESQEGRHHYKAGFALLPTVDHVEASAAAASFKICAWRTNDAKNDLTVDGFLALCERVLRHSGYRVDPPSDARPRLRRVQTKRLRRVAVPRQFPRLSVAYERSTSKT
ncbi:hypothetical protein [Paraburkholderia sp. BL17N1]|uniref:hypothetical protein n=1 Tax=Paraburkholderia sp. BL17N1 TaxID=1938798 RepID=UPI000F192E8C|nr:hypothetical protein [Paraburkholderia sp. BL17N1]RKR45946.1 hypothetical protein B0G82_3614 [Paraburkholderia sp. BL17N1]